MAQLGRARERELPVAPAGDLREDLAEQRGVVGDAVGSARADEHRDVGVRDHVLELVRLEAAVDWHGDGAELGRRQQQRHELDAVGHQDADLRAGPYTEREQRARVARRARPAPDM